jgi:hypothetical protein
VNHKDLVKEFIELGIENYSGENMENWIEDN